MDKQDRNLKNHGCCNILSQLTPVTEAALGLLQHPRWGVGYIYLFNAKSHP